MKNERGFNFESLISFYRGDQTIMVQTGLSASVLTTECPYSILGRADCQSFDRSRVLAIFFGDFDHRVDIFELSAPANASTGAEDESATLACCID